jgi:hypothetical protein
MLRRLLNFASVICLIACLALMGMWVRSRTQSNVSRFRLGTRDFYIVSLRGMLFFEEFPASKEVDRNYWNWVTGVPAVSPSDELPAGWRQGFRRAMGFYTSTTIGPGSMVAVPYWFVVLSAGILAAALGLRWPYRFTLGSVFIAMAFLAVVLGMLAWLNVNGVGTTPIQ